MKGWDIVFSIISLGLAMTLSAVIYGLGMLLTGAFSMEDRKMALKVVERYLPAHWHRRLKGLAGVP